MSLVAARRNACARFLGSILLLTAWLAATPASAQRVPSDHVIEILIKRNLSTFNDANITGNYEVWHATLSRPFRQQFSAERLKEAFKAFHDQNIDLAPILAQSPKLSEPARIEQDGALFLKGAFETRPSRVLFELRLHPAEGDWKLMSIQVNVEPADDKRPAGASSEM